MDLTRSYSGIFGHQVVLKNRRGKIVMILRPPRKKVAPSEKQVAMRERFRLAAIYARHAINDPELLAGYTAGSRKGLTPYQMAVHDFLKVPYIHRIDASGYHGRPGDKITVTASDDFRLVLVTVKISGQDGSLIEEGTCALNMPSGNYEYTAAVQLSSTAGIVVLARATDTPGNVIERSVILS
jgi:hypothetical protein